MTKVGGRYAGTDALRAGRYGVVVTVVVVHAGWCLASVINARGLRESAIITSHQTMKEISFDKQKKHKFLYSPLILLKLNSMAAIRKKVIRHQAAVHYYMRVIPAHVPAVNVPSKHDEAVQVNPAPVWVHEPPLASSAVQLPASSASANSTLASQGSAAHA